ncbi:MAG: NAD(P)-dependent oxidoreductase [Acidobacteriota bacterium]|nr:NAD(P)-dependent oxidoreductase [Acidobacteriota bacterium]
MKRALVTGGAGFLGSFIADALTAAGHEVVVFDRRPSPYLRPGQSMVVGDILDAEALTAAAAGATAVYHLAAASDLNTAADEALETARTNLVGTVHALEAARGGGAERFLLASTVYVYSRAGGFYRCSKQACEAYVEEFQRRFGLDYTVLRYGSLYGPRADNSNGVHRLLRQALEQGAIAHPGEPDDAREYIHVEDAAALSVQALAPEFANQHLTLSGSHPMRLRDLFTMFSEILGREVTVDYQPPGDSHYRLTPYAFSPRVGRKLTATCYVDMGQGLLQVLEELHAAQSREARPDE